MQNKLCFLPSFVLSVAKQFSIEQAYEGYEYLLEDPTIQAVYIPLPNHLHKEWVMNAAEKGKHILCEKPAGLNEQEATEMINVCQANNVLFMEAFMYHFHPQHQRVREIIDSGEIGEVTFMNTAFSFPLQNQAENIRMSKEKGGGSLYDVGCYGIHSIRNIFQEEPVTAYAEAVIDPTYQVDKDVIGQLGFASGKLAVFHASFQSYNRNKYEVVGSKGRIVVTRSYRPDVNDGEGIVIVETECESRKEIVRGDQYRAEIEHLSEAIQWGQNHLEHSQENTLNNMRVIDACYKSIDTGERVLL